MRWASRLHRVMLHHQPSLLMAGFTYDRCNVEVSGLLYDEPLLVT